MELHNLQYIKSLHAVIGCLLNYMLGNSSFACYLVSIWNTHFCSWISQTLLENVQWRVAGLTPNCRIQFQPLTHRGFCYMKSEIFQLFITSVRYIHPHNAWDQSQCCVKQTRCFQCILCGVLHTGVWGFAEHLFEIKSKQPMFILSPYTDHHVKMVKV